MNITSALPNVWGAGQLFAFSGLDGPTDWFAPFVLHTDQCAGSLKVRLPFEARLAFAPLPAPEFRAVLGDALLADTAQGRFVLAFADHHTLAGQLPEETVLLVNDRPATEQGALLCEQDGRALFAIAAGKRCALALGDTLNPREAIERCRRALATDPDAVLAQRAAFVERHGKGQRLLGKALSVLKTTVEGPSGRVKQRWMTSSRWPHRVMFPWDTVFQSLAFLRFDSGVAQNALLTMLEQNHANGMMPSQASPESNLIWHETFPPLMAWGVRTVLEKTEDADWAAECLPYLARYLDWIRANRDMNGNGIPEWSIGSAPSRGGESGLDNSPRFDRGGYWDAADFASYLCNDYECLAAIARRLGNRSLSAQCRSHAEHIRTAVNDRLWSEADGLYVDRDFTGRFNDLRDIAVLMPLFAGIPTPERAERLRQHINDPAGFAAPFPVPTVPLNSGAYCKDMWRGPTWLNTNYLIYCGLRRCGYQEEAERLRAKTLAVVEKWYRREGCLFEFYDSLDVTPPRGLDRKRRLATGAGHGPITDYGFTAAVTAMFILDGQG